MSGSMTKREEKYEHFMRARTHTHMYIHLTNKTSQKIHDW